MNRNIYTPEYLKNIAKIMARFETNKPFNLENFIKTINFHKEGMKENGVISIKKLPPFMVLDKVSICLVI